MAGAQTGKGAIDLCRRERPDLIILDIMLPDSDGLEICSAIRNHSELAPVPVIFLTARASETDRIVGLELGANDYIVKPFFVRELIARIKIHFRGQPPVTKLLQLGRPGARPRALPRAPDRQRSHADGDGVPAAGIPDEPARRGVQPRAVAGRRVGPRSRGDGPHRRRLHPAPAAEDRGGEESDLHPQRARVRLQLQRGSSAGAGAVAIGADA